MWQLSQPLVVDTAVPADDMHAPPSGFDSPTAVSGMTLELRSGLSAVASAKAEAAQPRRRTTFAHLANAA